MGKHSSTKVSHSLFQEPFLSIWLHFSPSMKGRLRLFSVPCAGQHAAKCWLVDLVQFS